jgi:hypothetical protein
MDADFFLIQNLRKAYYFYICYKNTTFDRKLSDEKAHKWKELVYCKNIILYRQPYHLTGKFEKVQGCGSNFFLLLLTIFTILGYTRKNGMYC